MLYKTIYYLVLEILSDMFDNVIISGVNYSDFVTASDAYFTAQTS